MPSSNLHPELFAKSASGFLQGQESHGGVRRVEKAIQGGPAGFHALGHGALGQSLFGHGLGNLKGQYPLSGHGLGFFQDSLVCQELFEATP